MFDIDRLDNRNPERIARVIDFVDTVIRPYHRAEVLGVERVCDEPALYVGNHNGGAYTIDTFLFAAALYRAHGLAAVPFGLGHEVVLSLPVLNELLVPLGAVRASHENALRLFSAGHKVLVYPGGDVEALRPFRHRERLVFEGRKGYVRLALRAGVPIIPMVSAGSHATFIIIDDNRWLSKLIGADKWWRLKAWPLTLSIPWGVTLFPFFPYFPLPVRIRSEFVEPIRFERTGEKAAADARYVDECAKRVEAVMQATLTRLYRELRQE